MSAWTPPPDDFAGRVRELAGIQNKSELGEKVQSFLSGMQGLELFAHWYDVVIPTLSETLRQHTAGDGPIDVTEDPLDAHIRIWNVIGDLAIRNGQPGFARDLFATLLRELRAMQPTRARVHKGTPYHQIGVSMLASGDVAGAEAYFAFAAIEDLISVEGVVDELNSPAWRGVRNRSA